jgi:hypothetical protein
MLHIKGKSAVCICFPSPLVSSKFGFFLGKVTLTPGMMETLTVPYLLYSYAARDIDVELCLMVPRII